MHNSLLQIIQCFITFISLLKYMSKRKYVTCFTKHECQDCKHTDPTENSSWKRNTAGKRIVFTVIDRQNPQVYIL
jgi:hypothetical protein